MHYGTPPVYPICRPCIENLDTRLSGVVTLSNDPRRFPMPGSGEGDRLAVVALSGLPAISFSASRTNGSSLRLSETIWLMRILHLRASSSIECCIGHALKS